MSDWLPMPNLPPWERNAPHLMAADYELVEHTASCADCRAGRACAAGDAAAEAEYRAFAAYRDAFPEDARAYADDQWRRAVEADQAGLSRFDERGYPRF